MVHLRNKDGCGRYWNYYWKYNFKNTSGSKNMFFKMLLVASIKKWALWHKMGLSWGWEFPVMHTKWHPQGMSPNIYNTPVCHVVFHSALMFFFHVLLSLHVRELFCLVNNELCDLNIYGTWCKLYVWQSSLQASRCRATPLFIHTSAQVVGDLSKQRLHNGILPEVPTLSVGVLPCFCFWGYRTHKRHPLIFHLLTTGLAAAAGNTRQMFPYLKKGNLSRWQKGWWGYVCFQTNRGYTGFITQREHASLGIVYREEFYRKPALTLHHSGF